MSGRLTVTPAYQALLGRYLTGDFRDGWSTRWLVAALPALAAACGLGAVFLRPAPRGDGEGGDGARG